MSVLGDFLTNIANAIRTKKGTTALINPQNFANEISAIKGVRENGYLNCYRAFLVRASTSDSSSVSVKLPKVATNISIAGTYSTSTMTASSPGSSISNISFSFADSTNGDIVCSTFSHSATGTSTSNKLFMLNFKLKGLFLDNYNSSEDSYELVADSNFDTIWTYNADVTNYDSPFSLIPQKLHTVNLKDATFTSVASKQNYFLGTQSVTKKVIMPKTCTTINTSNWFWNCSANQIVFDFSNYTEVPTLSNAYFFKTNNTSTMICKSIIVPDALYDQWIQATNWSTCASKIVKKSQYTE